MVSPKFQYVIVCVIALSVSIVEISRSTRRLMTATANCDCHNTVPTPPVVVVHPTQTLAVLVQGQNVQFSVWYDRIMKINASYNGTDGVGGSGSIHLFYASYDTPVNHTECQENDSLCSTFFVPGTTWTEGQNLLARYVYCEEKRRKNEFLYWVFSDDDSIVYCSYSSDPTECWAKFFGFIEDQTSTVNAPVIALPRTALKPSVYYMADTYDAMVNVYSRKYVPYLLPYASHAANQSWWQSQAIHFIVMQTCFPLSAIVPGDFHVFNPFHREYARGLNLQEIIALTHANYDAYMDSMTLPKSQATLAQLTGAVQLDAVEKVTRHVKKQLMDVDVFGDCKPLVRRFEDWLSSTEPAWGL